MKLFYIYILSGNENTLRNEKNLLRNLVLN